MCNCLNQLTDRIQESKEYEYVVMQTAFIDMENTIKLRTYSYATVREQDKKREKKLNITHTYCPFCGEKYK